MAEVVIELNLRRRSGVLAGAVAALRPLALEFRSQKLADRDGQPQLTLTTEGELSDLDELLEAFSRARGVSEVSDVRVDGQSLMHVPVQPVQPDDAEETPPAPEKSEELSPVSEAGRPESASSPESSGRDDQEDGFNDDEFARHVLSGWPEADDSKQETRSSERDEKSERRSRPSERPDPSGAPTSAMVRRRRRRR